MGRMIGKRGGYWDHERDSLHVLEIMERKLYDIQGGSNNSPTRFGDFPAASVHVLV